MPAHACPFCGAAIRLAPAPMGRVAGVLLGLTLAACGPKDEGSDSVADTTTANPSTTDDPSATSSTGITSLDSAEEAEVAAYAGPGSFDSSDTLPPDASTTGTDTGTTGKDTESSTGTESGTGTDTGTGSSSGAG